MTETQEYARGFSSSEPDDVEHAASKLFFEPDRKAIMASGSLSKPILAAVERGNRSAPMVLLLGYDETSIVTLQSLIRDHGEEPVKLRPWSRMVPLRLAGLSALSRAGDRESRYQLLSEVATLDNPGRIFLLDILGYLDAPELWHEVSGYLRDTSPIPEDVPSGAEERRVCDHAVDAYLDLFQFPVTFPKRTGGRYDPQEIDEVIKQLQANVPK
jgi:hypothetical protein